MDDSASPPRVPILQSSGCRPPPPHLPPPGAGGVQASSTPAIPAPLARCEVAEATTPAAPARAKVAETAAPGSPRRGRRAHDGPPPERASGRERELRLLTCNVLSTTLRCTATSPVEPRPPRGLPPASPRTFRTAAVAGTHPCLFPLVPPWLRPVAWGSTAPKKPQNSSSSRDAHMVLDEMPVRKTMASVLLRCSKPTLDYRPAISPRHRISLGHYWYLEACKMQR